MYLTLWVAKFSLGLLQKKVRKNIVSSLCIRCDGTHVDIGQLTGYTTFLTKTHFSNALWTCHGTGEWNIQSALGSAR